VYQWLAGELPFRALTPPDEMPAGKTSFSIRESVSPLPRPVDEILQMALTQNPDRRFANVQLFAEALEQACHTLSYMTLPQNIEVYGTGHPDHLT
jgi:hypothetical protein